MMFNSMCSVIVYTTVIYKYNNASMTVVVTVMV